MFGNVLNTPPALEIKFNQNQVFAELGKICTLAYLHKVELEGKNSKINFQDFK